MSSDRRGEPSRLGYLFGPVPEWVDDDYGGERIDDRTYILVARLYRRASKVALVERKPTPRLTLDQIASLIHWTHELRSLAKYVQRLRAENRYFTYTVDKDRSGVYRYLFTLHPDGPGVPKTCRTPVAPPKPHQIGDADGDAADPRRTQPSSRRTRNGPENGVVDGDSTAATSTLVAPQDALEKANLLSEGKGVGGKAGTEEPSVADAATRSREAQRRRENASLAGLPGHERDVLADLITSLDAHMVEDQDSARQLIDSTQRMLDLVAAASFHASPPTCRGVVASEPASSPKEAA